MKLKPIVAAVRAAMQEHVLELKRKAAAAKQKLRNGSVK